MLCPMSCVVVCVQKDQVSRRQFLGLPPGLCYTRLVVFGIVCMKCEILCIQKRNLQGPFGRPPAPRTGCTVSTEFTDNSFGPGERTGDYLSVRSVQIHHKPKTNRCERYPHSACVSSYSRYVVFQSKTYRTLSAWIVCF